jgi:type III pantothenate kinase
MNLVLDIGNTLTKAGIFSEGNLLHIHTLTSEADINRLVIENDYAAMLVSSVADCPPWLLELLESRTPYMLLDGNTPLPFTNLYETPHTLGTDRLAAVAGAMTMFPGQNALAIDAGSCITYDIIDSRKQYHGGTISPGIQMRCRAMHTFTARLPLVQIKPENSGEIELLGKHTAAALQSGAYHGTVAEITQMIRMYEDKFGDLQVVICGGDAPMLISALNSTAHHFVPDLILRGLNAILDHHVT